MHVAPTRKTVFASIATKRDTWQGTVLMVKRVLSSLLKRERSIFPSPTLRQWASVRTGSSFGVCF
jgi:hypothetical protein